MNLRWFKKVSIQTNRKSVGMKHPSKTFAYEVNVTEENREEILSKMEVSFKLNAPRKAAPGQRVYAQWEVEDGTEKFLPAFQVEVPNGRLYNIPSINLVVLYFDNAYFNWRDLQKRRSKLIEKLEQEKIGHDILNDLYAYYGRCVSCIQSLFAAMEALVSINIDRNTIYRKSKGIKWTSTTTEGMQSQWGEPELIIGKEILWLSMDEKLRRVLPQLSGHSFGSKHGDEWRVILELKKLRDDITHPKSVEKKALFEELFAAMLIHDFDTSMEAVKAFINFYANGEAQRIKDCTCDFEW